MKSRLPLVAVVGRPNVGKSTFFNRMIGTSEAVVDDLPGVTRDRREAETSWCGVGFRLVDTGGLVPETEDAMESHIRTQVNMALEEADLILFLVDAREGITEVDREITDRLRAHADSVLLIANKVESPAQEMLAVEAAELGFGTPVMISGQHGRGTGDLLDVIVSRIPQRPPTETEPEVIKFTLVGRPNVGKSSLANRLLGEARLIVHEEAGTTRDAIDVPFRYDGSDFVLVDTAGLRRRSHIAKGVEYYSSLRTRQSMERSDVVALVLDASEPLSNQDARIAGMITEAGKSLLFLFNKWDLVDKETGTAEAFTRRLKYTFPLLATSPVLYVSALSGLRVSRIAPLVRDLAQERLRQIPTSELNEALQEAMQAVHPPVRRDGKALKLFYGTQVAVSPPTFAIFTNDPNGVPSAYQSYIKNFFRERLGFPTAPLRFVYRARH